MINVETSNYAWSNIPGSFPKILSTAKVASLERGSVTESKVVILKSQSNVYGCIEFLLRCLVSCFCITNCTSRLWSAKVFNGSRPCTSPAKSCRSCQFPESWPSRALILTRANECPNDNRGSLRIIWAYLGGSIVINPALMTRLYGWLWYRFLASLRISAPFFMKFNRLNVVSSNHPGPFTTGSFDWWEITRNEMSATIASDTVVMIGMACLTESRDGPDLTSALLDELGTVIVKLIGNCCSCWY